MKLEANGIRIEAEDIGAGKAVLLIMGLGMQLIAWPQPFVQAIADAGYRVLRHDNRDIGLSQGFDDAGTPNLLWQTLRQRLGLGVRAAYSLQDMANDALGVMDALRIQRAHVIGVSMGGMIAQRMAATAPRRVVSLTSIMSSSGARGLPGPRADVAAALLRRPAPGSGEAALLAHGLHLLKLIGSPGYPVDDALLLQNMTLAMRRAYRPAGTLRQMVAIAADTGRDNLLASIACPALVLHGEDDALVPIACGRDTARRIPGAQFVAVPGMGHDMPPGLLPVLLGHILPFLRASEVRP